MVRELYVMKSKVAQAVTRARKISHNMQKTQDSIYPL